MGSKESSILRAELLHRYRPSIWHGIDTGDGWLPLIKFLYDFVDRYECVTIAQVKEKFGGLRFYIDHDNQACSEEHPELRTTIDAIEGASYCICEVCGGIGNTAAPKGGHWVRTLCDGCRRIQERPTKDTGDRNHE